MSEVSFTRPVGWSTGRIKRARLFAGVALAAVVLGLVTLTMPWYSFSPAGAAGCTLSQPLTRTIASDSNVRAGATVRGGCITGFDTVRQSQRLAAAEAHYGSIPEFSSDKQQPVPSSMCGIPETAFYLLLGGLLVAAAMMLRNGFPGLAGLMLLAISWTAFGDLQKTMAFGSGGQVNQPQSGLTLYGFALTGIVVLSLVGCSWVAWINHTERAEAKKAAKAEGREHELPVPWVHEALGKVAGGALQAASRLAEKAGGSTATQAKT